MDHLEITSTTSEALLHGLHLGFIALLGVGGCTVVLLTGLVSLFMIHRVGVPTTSHSSWSSYMKDEEEEDASATQAKPTPLLSPAHIDMVTKRKWKEVLAWIVFHPDELHHLDKTGQSILHHACLFRAPAEVIQMILWQAPGLAHVPNPDGEVPLHWAIRLSAPHEQLESLLKACWRVGTHAKDKDGNSPLSLLWDRHREAILETWWLQGLEKVRELHSWKRIMLFFPCNNINININSEHNSNDTTIANPTSSMDDDDGDDDESELHVACRSPTPPGFFVLMAQVYRDHLLKRDGAGRTPLHISCSDAVANRSSDAKSKVQTLLSLRQPPVAPCCSWRDDDAGRLPLHYALEAGVTWDEGLCELLECYPQSLNERDPRTLLDPYLLAATAASAKTTSSNKEEHGAAAQLLNSSRSLSTIYTLLRMNPSQLALHQSKRI